MASYTTSKATILVLRLALIFGTAATSLDSRSVSFGHLLRGRVAPAKLTVTADATCGGTTGYTCQGSSYGNCCSPTGFCGSNSTYCGQGCQSDFGTCPTSATSSDGSCGGTTASNCLGTEWGDCCSMRGYCGGNSSYCGAGCQSAFGKCVNLAVSSDGSCGGATAVSCQGSDYGNCCSMRGYCGANSSYCGAGCQSEFGTCFPSSTTSSSSTRLLTSPSSVTNTEQQSTSSLQSSSSKNPSTNLSRGAIAGAVIGSIAGFSIFSFLACCFWRQQRRHRRRRSHHDDLRQPDPTSTSDMTTTTGSSLSPIYVSKRVEIGISEPIREVPDKHHHHHLHHHDGGNDGGQIYELDLPEKSSTTRSEVVAINLGNVCETST